MFVTLCYKFQIRTFQGLSHKGQELGFQGEGKDQGLNVQRQGRDPRGQGHATSTT